jgi:uncharacterized protein
MDKITSLRAWLAQRGRAAVALSGGVDSALLALVSHQVLGSGMIAVTGDSESVPARDRQYVLDFCSQYGIRHRFLATNEFKSEAYLANPDDRCYYCKRELFAALAKFAAAEGYGCVLDGTNASDLSGHRPGYRALKENPMVKAPYVELGITKADIRGMARELGLSVHGKPASACLASRIPQGTRIEKGTLLKVDMAEEALRGMGMTAVRVRHHGELARLQFLKSEAGVFERNREKILAELKKIGYRYVAADAEYLSNS